MHPGVGGLHPRVGVCIQGGSASGGSASRGWADPPPPCEKTDRCKNITLPQTSFAGGNYL